MKLIKNKDWFFIVCLTTLTILSGCGGGSKKPSDPPPPPPPNYLYLEVDGSNYGLGDYPLGGTTIPVKARMYNLTPDILISKIDLYCDVNLVDSDETGDLISNGCEYRFTWDTRSISDGNHTLKAVATTNLGLIEVSKVQNISHIFYKLALAYDPDNGCRVRAEVMELDDLGFHIMSDGNVRVNGDPLNYDSSTKEYSNTFPSIKPFDEVSFTISKSGRNISKTYQIPVQVKNVDVEPSDIQRWLDGDDQELTISWGKLEQDIYCYHYIYILFYKSNGTPNWYYKSPNIQTNDAVTFKVPRSEIKEGTVYADVIVDTYYQGPAGVCIYDTYEHSFRYHLFSFSNMVSTRTGGEPQDIVSFGF